MPRALPLLAAVLVLWFGRGASGSPPTSFLTERAGFTAAEAQRIERGQVVARALAADNAEVAIAAAAIVNVPIAYYLQSFRAIESFKRSAEVQQIGRLSSEPSAQDLAGLTVDPADVDALKRCRRGACDVKLDAAGIQLVTARKEDVSAAYREYLAGYVARYLHQGNGALIEYHDEANPRKLSAELEQILRRPPYLHLQLDWPALAESAGAFRGTVPAPLESFVYWSKEKAASKPIISVTHAIMLPESAGTAVIASKQLYASHYMTASLGLTVLEDRGTAAAPRTLVVYVNRTRLDVFEGILGRIKRPMVRSRARSGAERMLGTLRERLQQGFRK